ncbi:MAG TPA: hypothetical protein VI653_15795, partial [Steroidobacteraceae bacterium]
MNNQTIDPETVVLSSGTHRSPSDGLCLEEYVAYLAGEKHSDRPACVSLILVGFGQRLNDVLSDEKRQSLKVLAAPQIGTAGDGKDEARGYLALDWLVRTYTPTWLELAGLATEAGALRALPPIV